MSHTADDACTALCCLDRPTQMEEFSRAFIHAIASVAGYGVESPHIDKDSNDLMICQYDSNETVPTIPRLEVQAKCSYAQKPKNGSYPFKLPIKNYNDLRKITLIPRMLVVVHVPDDIDKWLWQTDEHIALHYCGYWMSLKGMPNPKSKNTKTVNIPIEQRFTVNTLRKLMNNLALIDMPEVDYTAI